MASKLFFIKWLVTTGIGDEIYNAIDSEDTIAMVEAADRAISRPNIMNNISRINKKSPDKSKELRDHGNGYYSSGKIKEALLFYNMAIAYALPGTLEMMLAVSNRSAVLFKMKSFSCITDIDICLTMGPPDDLARKLNNRLLLSRAFAEEEFIRDMVWHNQFTSTFFTTDFKRNKDVNCVSSDVAFSSNDGVRQITAKRKISPGRIVAIEPAFVTSYNDGYGYVSCYYCNKLLLNPSPCETCCYAMFCSEKCSSLCMSDYHKIECQIVDFLQKIYSEPKNRLIVRAAIKLSLKLGWDGFIDASENLGSCRAKVASTREMYSVEDPISMLSCDDSQELVEGRMFNGSVICAIVLKLFDKVPNYFPKEGAKKAAAKKAMSKIMFHLYVHFTSTICFMSAAFDYKSNGYKAAMHTSMGWFSMSSKLKHSCQPNLMVVGMNDRIALLSIRTIEKGEELTISFIDHFLDYYLDQETTNLRAQHLFLCTKKLCSCKVCMEDWSIRDLEYVPMTDRQTELNRRFQSVKDICYDKDKYQLLCEVLDAFPVKSKQYHEAYKTLKLFTNYCQSKMSKNRCYSLEGEVFITFVD